MAKRSHTKDFRILIRPDVHQGLSFSAVNYNDCELHTGHALISGSVTRLAEDEFERRKRKYDYGHLECRLAGSQAMTCVRTRSWKGIVDHLKHIPHLSVIKTSQLTGFVERFYCSTTTDRGIAPFTSDEASTSTTPK